MGILDSYVEQNNLNKKESSEHSETVNIPLKVTGYEDDMFVGIRMDTKEEVKVKMRDVEQKGDFTRPSIADFSTKKGKRYAPTGESILMLESSYQEEDGIWNTRWANTLSIPKRPDKVVVLNANVKIVDKADYSYVEVSTLKARVRIQSHEELREALKKAFTATAPRARGFALIKVMETDGSTFIFNAFPNLVELEDEDGDKYKAMDTPENSLQKFEEDPKKSKIVFDLMNNPEIEFEIFIGARLYLGADTNKKVVENSYVSEAFKKEYMVEPKEDGERPRAGFKKTIMAIRARDDGSFFITAIKQLVNNQASVPIEELNM
jgi:hypothetical protein